MQSLFSFLGSLLQINSGVDDRSSQPQPEERTDEPSRSPTIDIEHSPPEVSWSPSTSIIAFPTPNASAISLRTPPLLQSNSGVDGSSQPHPDERIDEPSRSPTPDTEHSPPEVSWSPSPSIIAFPTPNASAISLWTPPLVSEPNATGPRDRPEVFVDASGSGIGVIVNNRWLAWTFTPNHPQIPVGPNNAIISSWSELIAVELGLLTVLAAGYRDTTIKLKSDNSGVVKAIRKRRWSPNHELDVILQRILSLSEENGLRLKVGWVLGVRNPADKPSRGRYPPLELMLDCFPPVPQYLAGMIQLVDRSSLRQ